MYFTMYCGYYPGVSIAQAMAINWSLTVVYMLHVSLMSKMDVGVQIRDGQLFNYRNNRDYFIGNNRHRVLFLDW